MINFFYRAKNRLEADVGVVIAVALVGNIFSVIIVEAPRLYSLWFEEQTLFGMTLCKYLWICHALPEIFELQSMVITCYQVRHTSSNPWQRPRLGKKGCKLFAFSSFPFLITSLIALSQVYQPAVGTSATLQDFPILTEKSFCPSQKEKYSWWYITFRWIMGFLLPLSTSILFLINHKLRFWKKISQDCFYFCACVIVIHAMSQTPLAVIHFHKVLLTKSTTHYSILIEFLASTLSKLHLSLFPIAVLCIMPWRTPPPVKNEDDLLELQFLYRQGQVKNV